MQAGEDGLIHGQFVVGDAAFEVSSGIYDVTVDFNNSEITLKKVGTVEKEFPETLYIIGYVNGNVWNPTQGVKMNNQGEGIYILENAIIENPEDNTDNTFSFCTQLGTSDDDWDGLGTRYGDDAGDGGEMTPDASGKILGNIDLSSDAFAVPAGKYTVTVDLEEMQLSLIKTGETGVSEISADNFEAVYFNLQGVKIEKPENGLFIEVRNGQTRKVIVK
ncbi:MAG: hypothetical protein K2J87_02405 [Muribaculaceae bacterium]|nr:hypothetical protein [Muribaculaceae bacterium]